ncbi:hypothetical protein SPRG_09818 [Saprolegnia parasitica CBS 223.65]|uniref:Uncharacterized protein n=1 Tax=Saprolegnia parasitica (strain CBS 223.65) TaxID=695850 RepID=A0A067C1L7_SAPPC|nr:hypothetical protein SPRG_09818 [Saprolegnia parasitica CBS 223.65]KDO24428.1 hypothetical protein SPRG_09818 [Saprolegnia parasitica CBS 223.65]|eukprot:XP_012204858.1 hypothetical protein SPRG_09818 [Saprolegnia parasitica CBS 223.65]
MPATKRACPTADAVCAKRPCVTPTDCSPLDDDIATDERDAGHHHSRYATAALRFGECHPTHARYLYKAKLAEIEETDGETVRAAAMRRYLDCSDEANDGDTDTGLQWSDDDDDDVKKP